MPDALTAAPSPTLPKPLYRQLQPRWSGLDREGVAQNQRLRLIGAMIEVAGSKAGYAGVNIKLLSALAGVSRQTFYDRFGTTEACFLAAYEYVVGRAARHVGDANSNDALP
jgi:AcrR family transcriptional regulator